MQAWFICRRRYEGFADISNTMGRMNENVNKAEDVILRLFEQTSFPPILANSVQNLLSGRKIILYGVGGGFVTFSVFVLKKYGLTASAVLDRKFKSRDTHFGIPAFSPLEYRPTNEDKESAVVVITIGKSEFHAEIFNCLREMGFKNVILATDIYEYHLPHESVELTEKGFDYYLENKKEILTGFDLFDDDLSREIYTQFLQTHMQRNPVRISSHPLAEQYFPRDIVLDKGCSRYISCGAYNGDTVIRLNALHGKVEAIACFEPDLRNYGLLVKYLCKAHKDIAGNVVVFPCGVFSRECQLHFESGNDFNGMISEEGESLIQCVAMDHVLPGFCPTYITMDVEGSEIEALHGAEVLIRESRPDLAICVYHSPNHIWNVPLYLKGLQLGYKFYLRNYTSFPSETVLYATA